MHEYEGVTALPHCCRNGYGHAQAMRLDTAETQRCRAAHFYARKRALLTARILAGTRLVAARAIARDNAAEHEPNGCLSTRGALCQPAVCKLRSNKTVHGGAGEGSACANGLGDALTRAAKG